MVDVKRWEIEHDGLLSEKILRKKLEKQGYQVTRYVYPPGTCFLEHKHSVDKIDAVLSGQFQMTMNGQTLILQAGDSLEVPQGVMHSAEVIGDEPVVSLDAVKI